MSAMKSTSLECTRARRSKSLIKLTLQRAMRTAFSRRSSASRKKIAWACRPPQEKGGTVHGRNNMGSTQNRLISADRRLVCYQHIHLSRACRKAASPCTRGAAETLKEDHRSHNQKGDSSGALTAEEPPWTTALIAAIRFARRSTLAGAGTVSRSLALTATASAGNSTQPGLAVTAGRRTMT